MRKVFPCHGSKFEPDHQGNHCESRAEMSMVSAGDSGSDRVATKPANQEEREAKVWRSEDFFSSAVVSVAEIEGGGK